MTTGALLTVLRLSRRNATIHLTPLLRSDRVRELRVLREDAIDLPDPAGKVRWLVTGPRRRLPPLVTAFRRGRAAAREVRLDAVVGFYLVPYGALAWLLARLSGSRVVLSLLGTDFNVHCHAWYGAACRALLRRADAVTVTGRSMLERLAEWGVSRERLHVLPHAIDVERFAANTTPAARRTDLLFVGRLIPGKRVDLLLRALSRVHTQLPQATLAIVGDGPERTSLERLSRDLDLAEAVTFAGRRDDVERWYADAKVFVMASEREGLPLVLIEAMCSGCVPVSTRCGTIEDLIEDGRNGFLVEVGDWQSLAERAVHLLHDDERLERMAGEAAGVRGAHTWSRAVAVWDRILESLA